MCTFRIYFHAYICIRWRSMHSADNRSEHAPQCTRIIISGPYKLQNPGIIGKNGRTNQPVHITVIKYTTYLQFHGRLNNNVFSPYVRLINVRFQLFRYSASSFSSQYLLLFLKSSRSCVLLIPTPFTSVICPSMASRRR